MNNRIKRYRSGAAFSLRREDLLHVSIYPPSVQVQRVHMLIAQGGAIEFGEWLIANEEHFYHKTGQLTSDQIAAVTHGLTILGATTPLLNLRTFGEDPSAYEVYTERVSLRFWQNGKETWANQMLPEFFIDYNISFEVRAAYESAFAAVMAELPQHWITNTRPVEPPCLKIGTTALISGSLIEVDYRRRSGLLLLRVAGSGFFWGPFRLDPWSGRMFPLIEFKTGNCFLVCGAQAVIVLDAASLTWRSSVGLEEGEAGILDSPWHIEIEASRRLIVATQQRVWCVGEDGGIQWLWSCKTGYQDVSLLEEPAVVGSNIRLRLETTDGEVVVLLQISDGNPVETTPYVNRNNG